MFRVLNAVRITISGVWAVSYLTTVRPNTLRGHHSVMASSTINEAGKSLNLAEVEGDPTLVALAVMGSRAILEALPMSRWETLGALT